MDKKFIVCTDSGCDLSIDVLNEHEVFALPITYELNGEIYTDTMKAEDCHKFYDGMREGDAPKTSQINMMMYMDFWRPLIEKYHLPVIHICLGSGVSGTYNSGLMAVEELKEELPDCEIHMIDSTLCSVGYGMLALQAADMRDKGEEVSQCIDWLETNKSRINTWYTTDELKYLYRSGRVSRLGAIVGDVLNICPILNLDLQGHLIVQEKVRGLKKTLRRIFEIIDGIIEDPQDQIAYICHSDIPEKAEKWGAELQEKYHFKELRYTYIGPTIGSNCGPGLMAVFFYGKSRNMDGYKGE